jgi:valyl-tRNA synthetase
MTEEKSAYEAQSVEPKWNAFWRENDFFKADPSSTKPAYCIVIPPPNVTGRLHMGHALVMTLQDVLIRWKRMSGFEALWVPGTDHAGISTQTVVERHLMKTENKRRTDYPREEFLRHVWKWKEENEHEIVNQLKMLGCSCDWSRQRFTMDEGNNRAVRTIFKKLFDQGLIYRGDYLVNWDPVTQTALADDEVEYEEQNSFLWHLRYPLTDGSGSIEIATTRPETMLGDTAVAVSAKDPRYQHLIGKTLRLPLMNRDIPIIADHLVDPEFGTGAVKVTPAHDPNDYMMGTTHKLPFINIMTPDGKINENGGVYEGLTMKEARQKVVADMQQLGLLVKTTPHVNRVGVSYRSKAIIEPYLSKQWFVRMEKFGVRLREIVESGKVKILPKNWENTYFHWIDNLRDWCISRQLWWGHRIPIWYSKSDPEKLLCFDGEGLPPEVAAHPDDWEQDKDVLDTWFSSALWPFATLGWPNNTPELKKFYPNSVLVTGHDILFFWVARMILMGDYVMEEPPFPETFIHGLIYGKSYWRNNPGGGITYVSHEERQAYEHGKTPPKDVHFKWEKMSKSKGNIIDPLEVMAEYGTDAIRMALCASATQAREIDLDLRRFEEYKNFANKVWNGARFVFMNLGNLTAEDLSKPLDMSSLKLEDRWILSLLNRTVQDVNQRLSTYQFDQAATLAYDFFWKDFCANYVEISKPILSGKSGDSKAQTTKQKLLVIILCQALRLLHPMAPFITEELFQKLKERFAGVTCSQADPYTEELVTALGAKACAIAPYPQVLREGDINPDVEKAFEQANAVVYTVRNIRGEMKIPPGVAIDLHMVNAPKNIADNLSVIEALIRTKSLQLHTQEPQLGMCSVGMVDGMKILVPIPEELLAQEKTRLLKERERLETSIQRIETQLGNGEFVQNAPAALVQKQQSLLEKSRLELNEVNTKLTSF